MYFGSNEDFGKIDTLLSDVWCYERRERSAPWYGRVNPEQVYGSVQHTMLLNTAFTDRGVSVKICQ